MEVCPLFQLRNSLSLALDAPACELINDNNAVLCFTSLRFCLEWSLQINVCGTLDKGFLLCRFGAPIPYRSALFRPWFLSGYSALADSGVLCPKSKHDISALLVKENNLRCTSTREVRCVFNTQRCTSKMQVPPSPVV